MKIKLTQEQSDFIKQNFGYLKISYQERVYFTDMVFKHSGNEDETVFECLRRDELHPVYQKMLIPPPIIFKESLCDDGAESAEEL